MDLGIDGVTAIVTGAARGIGAACSQRLALEGAAVVLTDVLDDEGQEAADKLRADGRLATYRHLDVSDESAWQELAEDLGDRGRVRVLVNNAGIGTFPGVEDETLEGWERVLKINQTGVWLGMKHIGGLMRRNGGGSIINMSSIFGAVGGFGGSVAYHATKGAVRLMTKTAAVEWATDGVRVNSVHPGFVETPMIEATKGTDMEKAILDMTPMGRLGRPEEIADTVAFLASERASYITGGEFYVDGGWTTR